MMAAEKCLGFVPCCTISVLTLVLSFIASPAIAQTQPDTNAPQSDQEVNEAKSFENSVGMKFVLIPAGKFRMGIKSGPSNERPAHDVTITKPFFLGVTEVTQRQWKAIMGTEPWNEGERVYTPKEGPEHPACNLNQTQAKEFCKRLSAKEKKTYRLPTEAEWEYACRAGTTTRYSFGPKEDINDYAWTELNAFKKKGEQHAHKVAQKKPNPWGLNDMHGNVAEWCSDWWGDYPDKHVIDPTGPAKGEYWVNRGGSWFGNVFVSMSASRGAGGPYDIPGEHVNIGLRVVCNVSPAVKDTTDRN